MEIRQEALLHASTVPVTALHEEMDKHDIYVAMASRSRPCSWNTVQEESRRKFLDKNDSYAAIEEALAKDAQVIVDSSGYIDAGSKVWKAMRRRIEARERLFAVKVDGDPSYGVCLHLVTLLMQKAQDLPTKYQHSV